MAQKNVFWDGKAVKMKKITFFDKKVEKNFVGSEKSITFAPANDKSRFVKVGAIAQLVEQRTENPCVPGSIPGGTTSL